MVVAGTTRCTGLTKPIMVSEWVQLRYVDGCRELNVRNTGEYIRKVLAGESPTFQSEHLAGKDRARETIAIQLRRCDGIDRSSFHIQTGFDLDALIGEKVKQYVGLGLLEDTGARVQLDARREMCR